jgi:hypothetical protein
MKHREMDARRRKAEGAIVECLAFLSGQVGEEAGKRRDKVSTLRVATDRYAALIQEHERTLAELRAEKAKNLLCRAEIRMLRRAPGSDREDELGMDG